MRERRYKILRVSHDAILCLFVQRAHAEFVSLAMVGVAEGADVVAVDYSYEAACFNVLLYRDDWDVVPDCQMIPVINDAQLCYRIANPVAYMREALRAIATALPSADVCAIAKTALLRYEADIAKVQIAADKETT